MFPVTELFRWVSAIKSYNTNHNYSLLHSSEQKVNSETRKINYQAQKCHHWKTSIKLTVQYNSAHARITGFKAPSVNREYPTSHVLEHSSCGRSISAYEAHMHRDFEPFFPFSLMCTLSHITAASKQVWQLLKYTSQCMTVSLSWKTGSFSSNIVFHFLKCGPVSFSLPPKIIITWCWDHN